MRTSLDHLPLGKRRELAFVVEVLTGEFKREIANRASPQLKDGEVLKIVLFGSYARGDWVEDPLGRYFSDYDLLVVVDEEKLTDVLEFWEGAEHRLLNALAAGRDLRTPVNFIVHTLADVNEQLARGRYFFVDIVRDGIALLEVHGQPFVDPQSLPPLTALEEAVGFSQDWSSSSNSFISTAGLIQSSEPKLAAFLLHQAAEHVYNWALLVLTGYSPKSHNLVRLRQLAEPLNDRLASVWPTSTKFEKRCFELLRAAYVKGRYSRHYQIGTGELDWIKGRVALLRDLVNELCTARIADLRRQAEGGD